MDRRHNRLIIPNCFLSMLETPSHVRIIFDNFLCIQALDPPQLPEIRIVAAKDVNVSAEHAALRVFPALHHAIHPLHRPLPQIGRPELHKIRLVVENVVRSLPVGELVTFSIFVL